MAMKTLVVGKCGNASTPVELIKGDNYTQKIMMRVPRYFGGVDLAPLAWSVTVENAAGATDEYALSAIRGEDAIEMEWIPGGTATAVPGIVKFKLSGFGEDKNILVWQSGTYHIRVKDTFAHVPGSETEAELTGVQKLIIYVDGELNKVIKAGTDAAEAAKAANKAADRANSVADGKNEGRITALEQFTTKPGEPYAVTGKLVQLDNFEGMPMNAVTRIEPAQAGSGEPSPSNIRPISGHTGAKLTRVGKNLVSESSATGALSAYTKVLHIKSELMPNTTYTLSFVASQAGNNLYLNEYISARQYLTTTGKRQSITFTTAEEVAKNNAAQYDTELGWIIFKNGVTNAEPVTFSDVQLEFGNASSPFEPYQGETFSASFGQNVYGGTLDWGKGVLTVDRAMVTLTGTENSVERNTTENAHYIRYNYFGLTQSAIADGAFCSHFKTRLNTDVGDQLTNTFEIHSSILYPIFRVSASLYPTDDVWKSYLAAQKAAGTPVQVCYKLATPTTIQLTPAQLTALQGMNNIFCDAGETTVSGRKDILWLTSGLIEQIDTLKKAIISLGGNV